MIFIDGKSNDTNDDDCNLWCVGGVEEHVPCLLGLAGGVRNLVSGGSDNVGNKTPHTYTSQRGF